MTKLLYGVYGLWVYLPLSGLSRKWRRFSRKIRGKQGNLLQQITLPSISWRKNISGRSVKIWEHDKANGNIRVSELAVLNLISQEADDNTDIFEIGTFDGRTALNLAFSSPSTCKIYTLDLKPEMDTAYTLASGERHMVEKEMSGARINKYRKTHKHITNKIHQLYGDSAKFDFSPYYDSCSLVFVDGSHAYDYVMSDTEQALKIVKKGGVIIWHDYGIWDGVTKSLEEIESNGNMGLVNINGTSFAYWKNE